MRITPPPRRFIPVCAEPASKPGPPPWCAAPSSTAICHRRRRHYRFVRAGAGIVDQDVSPSESFLSRLNDFLQPAGEPPPRRRPQSQRPHAGCRAAISLARGFDDPRFVAGTQHKVYTPSSASACATASPMPTLPPLITATLSVRPRSIERLPERGATAPSAARPAGRASPAARSPARASARSDRAARCAAGSRAPC